MPQMCFEGVARYPPQFPRQVPYSMIMGSLWAVSPASTLCVACADVCSSIPVGDMWNATSFHG